MEDRKSIKQKILDYNNMFEKAQLKDTKCCATCKYMYFDDYHPFTSDYLCENEERSKIERDNRVKPYTVCGFYD